MSFRSVRHAGWDELFLAIPGQGAASAHDLLMHAVSLLHRSDAELVRGTAFGRFGLAAGSGQRPRGMPVTLIEATPCGPGDVAGVQAVGAHGGELHCYDAGHGAVVSVVACPVARWAYATGIEPVSLWAPPAVQAREVFERAEAALGLVGMTFRHVYRTWLFVDSILGWYAELNRVRTDFYRIRGVLDGVVPASTGIGASNPSGAALVMDLLALAPAGNEVEVRSVDSPLQCSAQQYGSSFSRAVEVVEPGLRRIVVSGTASIGSDGQTLHAGDVVAQTEHTLDVVEAILEARGMNWSNMHSGIVYIRRTSDADNVRQCLARRSVSGALIVAAECVICRDELLVELELDAAEHAEPGPTPG